MDRRFRREVIRWLIDWSPGEARRHLGMEAGELDMC